MNMKKMLLSSVLAYPALAGSVLSFETGSPGGGTWTATGSMAYARRDHTATLLDDGRVLIAGGYSPAGPFTGLDEAELYDPGGGGFSPAGRTVYAHGQHASATLLGDGTVLIVGGTAAPTDTWSRPLRPRSMTRQAGRSRELVISTATARGLPQCCCRRPATNWMGRS